MKKLKSRLTAGQTLVRALSQRWIPISELAEILRYPVSMAYNEICNLSKTNGNYTLMLKEDGKEPCILILPKDEWRNLLRYLALLPRTDD